MLHTYVLLSVDPTETAREISGFTAFREEKAPPEARGFRCRKCIGCCALRRSRRIRTNATSAFTVYGCCVQRPLARGKMPLNDIWAEESRFSQEGKRRFSKKKTLGVNACIAFVFSHILEECQYCSRSGSVTEPRECCM